MWSIVCSPLLQDHLGLSLILYLNSYDLILPCAVTIVKFGVTLMFSFNLSVIFGKKVFVIAPFVVMSHCNVSVCLCVGFVLCGCVRVDFVVCGCFGNKYTCYLNKERPT